MTENSSKVWVGLFMVFGHFVVILLAISLTFVGGFSMDELTTILGFIGPLFAGYTSVIISFIIKHKNDPSYGDNIVNPLYGVVSFAIPVIFVIVTISLIFLKAFNIGLSDFNSFKTIIGIVQGAFGVYVGQFIYSMFEGKKIT